MFEMVVTQFAVLRGSLVPFHLEQFCLHNVMNSNNSSLFNSSEQSPVGCKNFGLVLTSMWYSIIPYSVI